MRLKSFYAKNMSEAMKMIRDTLGEDAIIVATHEENGGKSVRVTAAVGDRSPAFEIGQNGVTESQDWLQYDEEEENSAVNEELTDAMIRHGVPEDVTDQIVSYAMVIGFQNAQEALLGALKNLFSFRPLKQSTQKTRFMFIGPAGAGKTLTTAKFAAQSVLNGENVAVVTTDTERAGALEQLQAFTTVMNVDLAMTNTLDELKEFLKANEDKDYIYIDTAGLNPFDPKQLRALAILCTAGDIEPVLVLPSALDANESEDFGRIYAGLGCEIVIPTRLDVARRYGGLLSAAHSGNLSFAESGVSAAVVDGLKELTPKRFAEYLLPERAEQSTMKER